MEAMTSVAERIVAEALDRWEAGMLSVASSQYPNLARACELCLDRDATPHRAFRAPAADVRSRPRGPPRRGLGAGSAGVGPMARSPRAVAGRSPRRAGQRGGDRREVRRRRAAGGRGRRRPGGQPDRRRPRRPRLGAGRPRQRPADGGPPLPPRRRGRRRRGRPIPGPGAGRVRGRRGRPGRRRCRGPRHGGRRLRRGGDEPTTTSSPCSPSWSRPGSGYGPASSTPRRRWWPRPTGDRRRSGTRGGRRRSCARRPPWPRRAGRVDRRRRAGASRRRAAGRGAVGEIGLTLRAAAASRSTSASGRWPRRSSTSAPSTTRHHRPARAVPGRGGRAGASSAAGGDPRPTSSGRSTRPRAARRTATVQRRADGTGGVPPASDPGRSGRAGPVTATGGAHFAGRTDARQGHEGDRRPGRRSWPGPGTEVHALELVGGHDVGAAAGPVLDERARRAYQERIVELQTRHRRGQGRPRPPAGRTGRAGAGRTGRAAQRGLRSGRAGPVDGFERRAGPHRRHVPDPLGDPQAVRGAPGAGPSPRPRRPDRHVVLVPARDGGALDASSSRCEVPPHALEGMTMIDRRTTTANPGTGRRRPRQPDDAVMPPRSTRYDRTVDRLVRFHPDVVDLATALARPTSRRRWPLPCSPTCT